jgi:hypothetical protein
MRDQQTTTALGRLAGTVLLAAAALGAGEGRAETEGTYMVPKSEFLAEAVEAPTNKARFRVRPSGAELVYELPQLLDGIEPQRFVLRGPLVDGEYRLSGSGATARCPEVAPEDGCHIEYSGLRIQEEAAEEFLAASGLATAEVQRFRAARVALMRQGVGILRARLID